MPIESKLMERSWCKRCLSDHIDLHNMIGSLDIGTTASLVAYNKTKNTIHLHRSNHHEVTDLCV